MKTLPRDGLRAWFSELLALKLTNVIWEDEPDPIIGPKAGKLSGLLTISITSDENVLWEEDWAQNGDEGAASVTTTAVDTLSLNVLYESFESPKKTIARDVLTRLRVKGWQQYFREKLAAIGIVLMDVGTIRPLTRIVDDIRISAAQIDVQLRFTQTDVVTEIPTDFIESVEIFGDVGFALPLVLDDVVVTLSNATPLSDNVSGEPQTILPDVEYSTTGAAAAAVSVSIS